MVWMFVVVVVVVDVVEPESESEAEWEGSRGTRLYVGVGVDVWVQLAQYGGVLVTVQSPQNGRVVAGRRVFEPPACVVPRQTTAKAGSGWRKGVKELSTRLSGRAASEEEGAGGEGSL